MKTHKWWKKSGTEPNYERAHLRRVLILLNRGIDWTPGVDFPVKVRRRADDTFDVMTMEDM